VERYKVQNILNYMASEVQVAYNPLFSTPPGDLKDSLVKKALSKLEYVEKHVLKGPYLVGESFTIVDAQFYSILSCSGFVGIDLTAFPTVKAYYDSVASLPAVVRTHTIMATNPSHI
jgi:glutathione S-transferase